MGWLFCSYGACILIPVHVALRGLLIIVIDCTFKSSDAARFKTLVVRGVEWVLPRASDRIIGVSDDKSVAASTHGSLANVTED
jgi:hypothetical protein